MPDYSPGAARYTLRTVREADAPAIQAIYAPYVQNTTISFEYTAPDTAEMLRRIQALQNDFPWLCCEDAAGRLLGYAYAHRYAPREGYAWSAETTVYVSEAARQGGVGKRLYAALEALLTAQGYRTTYALVTAPNPPSDAFHKKLGYEVQGSFPNIGYKFGKPVGVTYYAKPLLPPMQDPPKPRPFCGLDPSLVRQILETAPGASAL